jgi:hypothetical protein
MNTGVTISIIILLIVLAIAVIAWFGPSKGSPNSQNVTDSVATKLTQLTQMGFPEKYITPATFEVGPLPPAPYKSSNLCNDRVLYPINGLGVDYGDEASDCPCTQFLAPP